MGHILLTVAILLALSHTAWAGAELAVGVWGEPCTAQTATAFGVNGVESISSAGTTDTGTATPSSLSLCDGTVTLQAACNGGNGTAYVYMAVNGTTVQTLVCESGENQSAVGLSWPVSGRYSVRIYGSASGTGTYTADTFRIPIAE